MGNCQAAEAATVVIQHPGNKIERIYWSVSARHVMNSNRGHYVALVLTTPIPKSENGARLKQLKLLRPDDTLLIGQVYRLISLEDVLKEFAAKKCVKLGKLLKERGVIGLEKKHLAGPISKPIGSSGKMEQHEGDRVGSSSNNGNSNGNGSSRVGRRLHQHQHHHHGGGGQWKPALKSIAEIGT